MCNEGAGKCKTKLKVYKATSFESASVETVGICVRTAKIDFACDDFNYCTVDDKCEAVTTDSGDVYGKCVGTFAGEIACDDYKDECTSNSKCVHM